MEIMPRGRFFQRVSARSASDYRLDFGARKSRTLAPCPDDVGAHSPTTLRTRARRLERHPMKTPPFAPSRWILLVTTSALGAGCAGPAMTDTRRPVVGADYEQIYITGSHIPILVPKSPTARRLPTFSPTVVITPDEIRQRGNFPMH
jgi:hypothetical protein